MAAGMCKPEENAAFLHHAVQCRACADRLQDLIDAAGLTAEEPVDPIAGQLAIRWKKERSNLAASMAGRTARARGWLIPVAALLLLAVTLGTWMLGTFRNSPPLGQIASAYSARRNLELQIPGAAYSPIKVERGPISSVTDIPAALLESQAQIKRHLESRPEDAAWIHAQGRAALLLWDFETALRSFQMAADLGEKSSDFLVDFASAYFERAEQNGSALDYTLALEKLGQALQAKPDHLPTLFNRAIIRAKLFQYDPAIVDFEEYIRREPDAGWRQEAQERLEAVRRSRARVYEPGRDVPPVLQTELAIETAMTSALREYFRNRTAALESQAIALRDTHSDPWLLEVIGLPETASKAVEVLTEMAILRTTANLQYDRLSEGIRLLTTASVPPSLGVWRDFELLYYRTRTLAVASCPDTTNLRRAARPYAWLGAQIALESSLCRAGREDFGGAASLVDEAEQIATAHDYRATLIRVPNFRGQRLVESGYSREAIQTAVDTLAKIDSGGFPLRRSYDFHVMVMKAAMALDLPHTAHSAAWSMGSVGRGTGAPLMEMIGDSNRARFAFDLNHEDEASQAYAAAQAAFRKLGETPTARIYWRVARAGWLEIHGERQELYEMLREAHGEESSERENLYFNRQLIAALCRLELRLGNYREVEDLAESFWKDVTHAALEKPGPLRTYLPEIDSVTRSLTTARILAGRPDEALNSWRRFVRLHERLLGGTKSITSASASSAGTAFLTVAALDNKAALWLRTSHGTRFQWASDSYSGLVDRVRLLRRLASLESTAEQRIAEEARQVYSILFPSGLSGINRVYIAVAGELRSLPLSTFLYSDEGRDVVFSFLPFGGSAPAASPKSDRVGIIAATVFDRNLGALPDLLPSLEKEVEAVGSVYQNRSLLQGAHATAKAVHAAAVAPGVLHFAGHSIPWRGGVGLVVAPDAADQSADGRAGIWVVTGPTVMRSDLVVFSACRSAEFNDTGSVQPGQLAEAALLAGAGEVVATLWNVDSTATAAWMRSFYEHLGTGRSPAEAVRMASLNMRSQVNWRHPRYWAAFADYERGVHVDSPVRAGEDATLPKIKIQ